MWTCADVRDRVWNARACVPNSPLGQEAGSGRWESKARGVTQPQLRPKTLCEALILWGNFIARIYARQTTLYWFVCAGALQVIFKQPIEIRRVLNAQHMLNPGSEHRANLLTDERDLFTQVFWQRDPGDTLRCHLTIYFQEVVYFSLWRPRLLLSGLSHCLDHILGLHERWSCVYHDGDIFLFNNKIRAARFFLLFTTENVILKRTTNKDVFTLYDPVFFDE